MRLYALTRKVTRHITILLLPPSIDVALSLKQHTEQSIKNYSEPTYIVDAFSSAATKYSRHEETANSIERWIVRCTLVPHGYCRANELEEGCHHLEYICGLIETECGYYLLLVVVGRTNCKRG